MSLADALFFYICCILYLYFVNSINYIFSIRHFILWSRDLSVRADVVVSVLPPRLWLMKFCRAQTPSPGHSPFRTWSSLTALNAPDYECDQCLCVQKAECHPDTEGSIQPLSPFRIRTESWTWRASTRKRPVANDARGLHALLQHIPS